MAVRSRAYVSWKDVIRQLGGYWNSARARFPDRTTRQRLTTWSGEDRRAFPDVGRIPEGWSSSRIFPQNNLAKTPMRAAGLARSAITGRAGSWRASARMGGSMLLVFDL